MSDDPRKKLAAFQESLARVLTRQESAPCGFDEGRLSLAADRLHAKRRATVEHLIPHTVSSLGDAYAAAFAAYATAHPSPPPEGVRLDAVDFLKTLDWSSQSDAAREESLFLRLQSVSRIGFAMMLDGHALLGVRLPLFGRRVVRIPWLKESAHKTARLKYTRS